MKTKKHQNILPNYLQLPVQINIKNYEGEKLAILMKLVSKLPFSEVTLLKWVQQIVYWV
jgi:hypothetical protein